MFAKSLLRVCIIFFSLIFIQNLSGQLNRDSLEIYYGQNNYFKVINHANKNIDDFSQLIDTVNVNYYFKSIDALAKENYSKGLYSEAVAYYNEILRNIKDVYGENTHYYAYTLNELALCYLKQKKYLEAEQLFKSALYITEQLKDKSLGLHGTILNNLGFLYQQQGSYIKSEPLLKQSIDISLKVSPDNVEQYIFRLNDLVTTYYHLKKHNLAELVLIDIIRLKENSNQPDYLVTLNTLAAIYFDQGKYSKAIPLYIENLELINTTTGVKNDEYYGALNNLASAYRKNRNFSKAEPFYLKALDYSKSNFSEEHIEYATCLNNLGLLYLQQEKNLVAKSFFLDAIEIFKLTSGEKSLELATVLDNLAQVYHSLGKYLDSERLFKQALAINEILGKTDFSYAKSLNNLSALYMDMNEYHKAEMLLLKSIEIKRETIGEKHPSYALTLRGLASFYKDVGNFKKAEILVADAAEIIKVTMGENNPNYADILNDLAELNYLQDKLNIAEHLNLRAFEIQIESLGENHNDLARTLNNLSVVYVHQNKFDLSEQMSRKALEIIVKNIGVESMQYASTAGSLSNNLESQAIILEAQEKYEEAQEKYKESEKYLLQSIKIIDKIAGINNDTYNQAIINLFGRYIDDKNYDQAFKYVNHCLKYFKNRLLAASSYLSSNELLLLKNVYRSNLTLPLFFLEGFKPQNEEIIIKTYENELLVKSLFLRNQERIKAVILKSDNQDLKLKYINYMANNRALGKMENIPLSLRSEDYDSLLLNNQRLEKEIVNLSTIYSDDKNTLLTNFEQIIGGLQPDEVILDLVEFNFYNKIWNDSTMYNAFVLKNSYIAPKYISLFEQKQLDSILLKNEIITYSQHIDQIYSNSTIYNLFINPIVEQLEGVNTLYISLAGLGHQINFSALPISDNQTLGEKYEVHILNSSANLIKHKTKKIENYNNLELLLYGDIDYDKSILNAIISNDTQTSNEEDSFVTMSSRSGITKWGYLSGTEYEITSIQKHSEAYGFKANIINGKTATKTSILNLDGKTTPFVLHLATHGYFFEDPQIEVVQQEGIILNDLNTNNQGSFYKASEDPMLRSGLIFAGANRYWGKPIDYSVIDNGILTAKEISNLDLSACDLVVLSACETGLGELAGSEGVYGLQRAFKMAGVKNIIMSLWKIPDAQTAELFDLFYEACFNGNTIHTSLRMAQLKMKEKYSPYYWAGFVLLE